MKTHPTKTPALISIGGGAKRMGVSRYNLLAAAQALGIQPRGIREGIPRQRQYFTAEQYDQLRQHIFPK